MKKTIIAGLLVCVNMISVHCMERDTQTDPSTQSMDKSTQTEPQRHYFTEPLPVEFIMEIGSAKRIIISDNRCCVVMAYGAIHLFEDREGTITGYFAPAYGEKKMTLQDDTVFALWAEVHRLGAR